VTLPSGSWIRSDVSIRGIFTSRFSINAASVLGKIFSRLGSERFPGRVARALAISTALGASMAVRPGR